MSGATAYTVTIDGLIIQDGNANNNSNGSDGLGAGLEFVRSSTGTAYHQVYISNCDFRYNTATKGAALNYSLYILTWVRYLNLTSNNFYHNISDEAAILNSYIGTATLASFYLNFTSNLVYRNRSTSNSTGILALLCQNNANASSLLITKSISILS
ncbi:MAG: hypothetical protein IPK03_12995 [Bacteroidetes bacterium]|nr:hypothetical protein [Bacteroidota bacterium]